MLYGISKKIPIPYVYVEIKIPVEVFIVFLKNGDLIWLKIKLIINEIVIQIIIIASSSGRPTAWANGINGAYA